MLNELYALPIDLHFFEGALPEAAFWGRLALSVGVIGFIAGMLLVLAHLRDRRSLMRAREYPERYRAPKWGPLDRALGNFFADPLSMPLSPDAASEYVTGRLDAEREMTQSIMRYFSYAPLLFGLMGTILGLKSLLVTSGKSLQDIEPLLSGVFAGTLGGIIGSLIAAIGGLWLDRVALSSGNQAQDFAHRFIIPQLPERRIAVSIEDAVLKLIAERAQAVATTFRNAMSPVAAQFQEVAIRCGQAAEAATNAFGEASDALRETGNLETASRSFRTGARLIESAAEHLSDATKQTAEVILRLGEVRASLAAMLERLESTAGSVARTSEQASIHLADQIANLAARGREVQSCTSDLRSSIERVSLELARRANIDAALLEAANSQTLEVHRALTALARLVHDIDEPVRALICSTETISKSGEALQQDVANRVNCLAERFAAVVEGMTSTLDRISQPAEAARIGNLGPPIAASDSDGMGRIITEAVQEMRRFSEQTRLLTEAVRTLQVANSTAMETKKVGLITRIFRG
jgi:exonuclease VII small subunit